MSLDVGSWERRSCDGSWGYYCDCALYRPLACYRIRSKMREVDVGVKADVRLRLPGGISKQSSSR